MKTLVLSADDIQQFTKLIYDQQKTAAAIAAVTQMEQTHMISNNASNSILNSAFNNVHQHQQQLQQQQQQQHSQQQLPAAHIMSLQYYLKHPSAVATSAASTVAVTANAINNGVIVSGNNVNYPTTVIPSHQHPHSQQQQPQQLHHISHSQQQHQHHHTQQQQQQQQQQRQHSTHTSNLRLKQPNGSSSNSNVHHHHQLSNSYHAHQHHPYYNGSSNQNNSSNTTAISGLPHIVSAIPVTTNSTALTTTNSHVLNRQHNNNTNVPVHALNQNSNFSAASSSTGGGTNSSHAPTQQSNTTGPSLSPPAAVSANPRTQSVNNKNANSSNSNALITPPPRYTIVNSAVGNSNNSSATSTRVSNVTSSNTKKIRTEPILSQVYQSERLTFANAHLTWSQEHWRRLLFQDERKFNLDGPDGYSNYYHDLRNYERTLSQRPRGISVYVYLLITAAGPIHLEVSTTKVGAESVIDTLLRQRSNIIAKLGGNTDFLLQDHNWTTNALPAAQDLLNAEGIKTQKWPTIAHDMNIMENVWGWIIREVYDGGRMFSRKDDLIFRIREAWARLPMDLIRNLYSTLPERVSELYLTRGAYTNC